MAISNLNLTVAADQACISMGRHIAKIMPFAHSLNSEAARKGTVVRVPKYAAAAAEFSTAEGSENTYAQTTGVAGADVTLDKHPVAGFAAGDTELMGADVSFVRDAGVAAGRAIARYIEGLFMGMPKSGVSGIKTATLAATKAGFVGLYKTAMDNDIDPAEAVLVLNPTYYAALLNAAGDVNVIGTEALAKGVFQGGFAGFPLVECSASLATDVVGFIAEKGAMAFAARAIEEPVKGAYPQWGAVQDPATGAPVTLLQFVDLDTGTAHVTCTCQFGCAILDAAHVVYLTAA